MSELKIRTSLTNTGTPCNGPLSLPFTFTSWPLLSSSNTFAMASASGFVSITASRYGFTAWIRSKQYCVYSSAVNAPVE